VKDLSTQVDFFLSNPDYYKTFIENLVELDKNKGSEEEEGQVKLLHGLTLEEVDEAYNSIIETIPMKERPKFTLNTLENTFFVVFIAIKYPYLVHILLHQKVIAKVIEWMEGIPDGEKRIEWDLILMMREQEAVEYMNKLTQNQTEEDEEDEDYQVTDEERVEPSFQRFLDALGWKVREDRLTPEIFSVFHSIYRHSFSYVTLPLDKLTKAADKQKDIRDNFILQNQAYFKRFVQDLKKDLPNADIIFANDLLEQVKADMRMDKEIPEEEARNSKMYGMKSEFYTLENTFRLFYFCLKDGTGLECENVFSPKVLTSLFNANDDDDNNDRIEL